MERVADLVLRLMGGGPHYPFTALNCCLKTLRKPKYKFDPVESPTSTGFVWSCRCTLFHPHTRMTEGVAIDKKDAKKNAATNMVRRLEEEEETRARHFVQCRSGQLRERK